MDFYNVGLEGEYLQEFIGFLEKLKRVPAKVDSQTARSIGDNSARNHAIKKARSDRYLADEILKGIDRLKVEMLDITLDNISDIVRSVRNPDPETLMEKGPLFEDLEPGQWGSGNEVDWMCHTVPVMGCLKECLALQMGREQEYIDEIYPLAPKSKANSNGADCGWRGNHQVMAFDYLSACEAYEKREQGMRDIFMRASKNSSKRLFENGAVEAFPSKSAHERNLLAQEFLQGIAEIYALPLPDARNK